MPAPVNGGGRAKEFATAARKGKPSAQAVRALQLHAKHVPDSKRANTARRMVARIREVSFCGNNADNDINESTD